MLSLRTSAVIRRLCAGASAFVAISATAADVASTQRWYDILLDEQRVGSVHEERMPIPSGTVETQTLTLGVQQLRRLTAVTQTITLTRDTSGAITAVDFRGEGGASPNAWQGTVRDGRLHWQTREPHKHDSELAFPGTVWTLAERARQLVPAWRGETAATTLSALEPVERAIMTVTAQRAKGSPQTVPLQLAYRRAESSSNERLWFDAAGAIARLDLQLLGVPVSIRPCRNDCTRSPQAGIDPIARMVVRSPVRIPGRALHAQLRYLVTRSDGKPPQLVTTHEQGVQTEGSRAVVSVCTDCGAVEQPTAQELARYLAPNAWVRSDAHEVRQLAHSAATGAQRTDLRMAALVRATMQRMRGTPDFVGYADAVQALRSGSGDCTEFAVLLAALARAQHIPARVVAGLAYSSRFSGKKDVFSPHMWVQAWDGESWKSYDAALGEFDSTHIALGVGDGNPDELNAAAQQLPLLRIEKAAVVRDP